MNSQMFNLYKEFCRQMMINNMNFHNNNNWCFNNLNNNFNICGNKNMNNCMNNNMQMNLMNNQMNNKMQMNFMNNGMNCNMNNIQMNNMKNFMNNNMKMNIMNNPMNNNMHMNMINNPMNNNNLKMNMMNRCMNNNFQMNMMNNNFINNSGNFNNLGGNMNNINNSNFILGNASNSIESFTNSFSNLNLGNSCDFPNNWNNPLNNNINNQNNFPIFRNFTFNNKNNFMNSLNDKNKEITIKFTFMACQVFLVKAKMNEKFSDVIKKFEKKQCPDPLKKHLSIPLFNGQKIKNIDQTLSEIGIKDNSLVLFIINNKDNNYKKMKNKEKKQHKLTEDELIQVKKWLDEYEAMKKIKSMLKSNNNKNSNDNNLIFFDDRESINNFMDFVMKKEQCGSITVKEHKHKLVYCLTDFKWKCNLCNKNYTKNGARYFCSICDFNMCDECHSKGNYTKKKVFPDGVTPSNTSVNIKFFKTDYHNHRLVYCRSSRAVIGYNGWICDNCRDNFENDIWSFFCTNCDFDICCSCAGFH